MRVTKILICWLCLDDIMIIWLRYQLKSTQHELLARASNFSSKFIHLNVNLIYCFLNIWLDISRVQDDEVGHGITWVVVLAGELLREAARLIATTKIHPLTFNSGLCLVPCNIWTSQTTNCTTNCTGEPQSHKLYRTNILSDVIIPTI